MNMLLSARRFAALLFLVLGVSCFAQRHGLSRDSLLKDLEPAPVASSLPSLEALMALRVPEPASSPSALEQVRPRSPVAAARLAIAKGDIAAAEVAWRGGSADLLADRCIAEAVLRRYDRLLDACGGFLEAAPEDPRAVGAARTLSRASQALRAGGELVAHAGPGWIKKCGARGGACADLAFVVTEKAIDSARAIAEHARFEDAVLASGRIREGRIEGPYDGVTRVLFELDAAGTALPPRPHLFGTSDVRDDDGVFTPAHRGTPGVYRLRFIGRGEGRASLFATSAGFLRVRVDGLVLVERSPDRRESAITRAAVDLRPGTHVVEVLAESRGMGDRITVALLHDDGTPALVPADEGARRSATGAGAAAMRLSGALENISSSVDEQGDPADVDALYGLLWRASVARAPSIGARPDEAQELARTLVARFGWSPLALATAAEILGDDTTVPERIVSSSVSRLWQIVRARWPDHPVAAISLARDLKDERPDEALAAYRALVAARPEYPFGHRELIDLALENGLLDEARVSAEKILAMEESPENIDAALPALRETAALDRASVLEEKRALLSAQLADTRSARLLLRAGKTSEGLEALAMAAAKDPRSRAVDDHVGLLALQDPAAALARLDDLLRQMPNDPDFVERKTELLRALRGDEEARTFLLAALPRVRSSARARQLAEELGVLQPWSARLALADQAIAALRARAEVPFGGHGSLALIDDVERFYYEDDSSVQMRHLVVELRSKEVLDRFGEVGTGDARVLKLRVVKPNGRVIEAERHRGVDDASLPQLAPGDIIELLTAEWDEPAALGGTFETRALDEMDTPALSRRYIVSFPEDWDVARGVEVLSMNGLAPPRRELGRDGEGRARVRLEYELTNVDAEIAEPFAPGLADRARRAGLAYGVDDAFWARYRGLSLEQASQRDAWLDACARRIAGEGDDDEKLARIFTFVARRIEPGSTPDGASAVLATGQGRRTPLFLALLRGAGLDAAPVALQLPAQPDLSKFDASSWSLLAVRVRVGDRARFAIVDGSAVLDALPPSAKDARVLDLSLHPTTPLVTTLPDTAVDAGAVAVQVSLAEERGDGAGAVLRGLIVVTVPPSKADGVRRGVRRLTPEQLGQVFEGAFADSLPGLRVLEMKLPDPDAAGSQLRLGARVEVPIPEQVDGAARFEHLFAQGASGGLRLVTPLSAYLAVPDRKQPLVVAADAEVLEVQISLAAPGAFVEAPESTSLDVGPFSLRQRTEVTNGALYWRRELRSENAKISVSAWPKTRAGLARIAARADARVALVLPRGEGR